jgi:hypothetical protein
MQSLGVRAGSELEDEETDPAARYLLVQEHSGFNRKIGKIRTIQRTRSS